MADRFRFSLTSLLVVVSFAAVLFGWWSDHRKLRQRIEELERYDAPLLQQVIESGQMTDPVGPPIGMSRVRPVGIQAGEPVDQGMDGDSTNDFEVTADERR